MWDCLFLTEKEVWDFLTFVEIDAGDMFQGTLESNLEEGAPVVRAYNVMGYTAAAIGNHEFDFGPTGPAPAPIKPGDDARGALKARAAEARFPFLAANIVDGKTRKPVTWPNVLPSIIIDAAGIKVGIVGVSAASTGRSALPANVAGLDFLPLARTVALQARRLRGRGAKVVIAVAHEGGECTSFTDADSLDSCDAKSEIFSVVRALPKGSVDAHGYFGATPALDGSDAWDTPLGRTMIDESLRQALSRAARSSSMLPPIDTSIASRCRSPSCSIYFRTLGSCRSSYRRTSPHCRWASPRAERAGPARRWSASVRPI